MDMFFAINGNRCSCGRIHKTSVQDVLIGNGVIEELPKVLARLNMKKPFILADQNTMKAAGEKVTTVLKAHDIAYSSYVIGKKKIAPDEETVGSVMMHFDLSCDGILAVGSGVINDTGKILSNISGKSYIIVGTAPSMDGYASKTSSMDRDGLKISLPTRCADVILGDTDVLCAAPEKMLVSGLGDMVAKYVSICEWRIAALLTGEYYCEEIAKLVRASLDCCVRNASRLIAREETAVQAVFEGLVVCGAAMEFAGLSRPASGVEHYFSHVWDMRALSFHTPAETHGIQCAIGTLYALKIYEKLRKVTPDGQKAREYVSSFNLPEWNQMLRSFIGEGAEAMIAAEKNDGKYDLAKHAARLPKIIDKWHQICCIMDDELPSAKDMETLLDRIHCPKTPEDFGLDHSILPLTFKATKDIRDKYVLSRLCWDLGVLDEIAEML